MAKNPAKQANRATARQARARARAAERRRQQLVRLMWVAGAAAAVAVLGLGVAQVGHGGHQAGTVTFERQSRRLSFDLPAFAGGRIASASLAGKPLVLNFYASWCDVCNAEMPQFELAHQALKGKVGFIGVNPQSNDTDAAQAAMVRRTGITYPTARDADDRLLNLFNTTGALPTTLFMNGDGRVVDVHNGGLDRAGLLALIASDLGVRA